MGIRIIFLFLFSLVSCFSFGQLIQKNTTYGISFNRTGADTLLFTPTDTFSVPLSARTKGHIARKGSTLYLWNTSTFIWEAMAGGGGSVPETRTISTGYGLTGGGDLSINRTHVFDSTSVFSHLTWLRVLKNEYQSGYYSPNIDDRLEIDMQGNPFGAVNVSDFYMDLTTNEWAIQGNGGSAYTSTIISQDGPLGDMRILRGLSATKFTEIRLVNDSLMFFPDQGRIHIDSLAVAYGDTTTWKPVVWSPHNKGLKKFNSWGEIGLSGATPTLQQVVAAGNTLVNNSIAFSNSGGRGYIQWDAQGNGTPIAQFDGGDYSMKFYNESDLRGIEFDWTDLSNSTKRIKFPDFTASDYFAIAGYANAWGDGVKQTFNPNGTNAGINVGSHTAAPSSLANGDLWYNSTSNELNARINGSTVALGAGSTYTADLPVRVTGTVISADTSVANNPSLTTNARTQKLIDSLNGLGSYSSNLNFEPWYSTIDEMRTTVDDGFIKSQSGTGTNFSLLTTTLPVGWMFGYQGETGTTSSGYAWYGANNGTGGTQSGIAISSSYRYNCGSKIMFEDLSNGTETYEFHFGFSNWIGTGTAKSNATDGAYFRYTHGDSSGTWIMVTENNNTKTEDATDITVAADTEYTLEITVYNDEAKFYINKVLKGTLTTNLPSGTGARVVYVNGAFVKTAGTTERVMYLDWAAFGKRSN